MRLAGKFQNQDLNQSHGLRKSTPTPPVSYKFDVTEVIGHVNVQSCLLMISNINQSACRTLD